MSENYMGKEKREKEKDLSKSQPPNPKPKGYVSLGFEIWKLGFSFIPLS